MTATIKDIGRKANVSAVTVSRALNNKPDINIETKSRILKIAKELNYTPNLLAKSMVTRKTGTIGVIIPNTLDLFYFSIVNGISEQCLEQNYSIILCNANDSEDNELDYIRQLQEKRVEGILLYPVQKDERYIGELKNCLIPVVFLNRHTEKLNYDYVINDNV